MCLHIMQIIFSSNRNNYPYILEMKFQTDNQSITEKTCFFKKTFSILMITFESMFYLEDILETAFLIVTLIKI